MLFYITFLSWVSIFKTFLLCSLFVGYNRCRRSLLHVFAGEPAGQANENVPSSAPSERCRGGPCTPVCW